MSRGWHTPARLAAFAVLVGFALRVYAINAQSLWGDEIYSVLYSQMGWRQIIEFNIQTRDPQPPLYYLLLKAYVQLAGTSELAYRYLSLAAGVISIALVYALGRKVLQPWAGAVAATVLASNAYHVWYAQETRTYTLTTCLTLVSLLLVVRILRREASRATWIASVVSANLLVYSHYYGFLIILFENVVAILILWHRRHAVRPWLLAQAAFIAPYLPFANHGLRMMLNFQSANPVDLSWNFLQTSMIRYSVGWFLPESPARWLTLGFLVLAAVGVLAIGQPLRHDAFSGAERAVLLLGYLLIPVAGALIVFRVTGRILLADRYFILITPAYYLLIGHGITTIGRFWKPAAMIALTLIAGSGLWSVANYYTDPRYARFDLRGIATYIARYEQPGDRVVVMGDLVDSVFRHYYHGRLPIVVLRDLRASAIDATLAGDPAHDQRIWLIPYADTRADRSVEGWLNQHAYRLEARWFKTARLRLYSLPAGQPAVMQSTSIPWEGGIVLARLRLARTTVEAGRPVDLQLGWRNLANPAEYRVAVQILDQDGHVLASNDYALQDVGWTDRDGLLAVNAGLSVPFGTPPGQYQIVVSLLGPGNRNLAYLDVHGVRLGTAAPIATIAVTRPASGPPLEQLAIARRVDLTIGDGLRLGGVELPDVEIPAGQPVTAVLYWQALAGRRETVTLTGQLVDAAGAVVDEWEGTTALRHYPPSIWSVSEIVRDYLDIPTGHARTTGQYQVRIGVTVGDQRRWLTLGTLSLVSRDRRFDPPAIAHRLDARFVAVAELLGFDLKTGSADQAASLVRGQPLTVTLYWRASEPTDRNYTAFVQILDGSGRLVAQHDGMPDRGHAVTSTWVRGEIVVDPHQLTVPPDLPAGSYRLIAGLYDARTGERLHLTSGQDSVDLARVDLPD